ncbi:DegT/DnrJ/EryC1/StrS family aminotransferase [Agromyces marinus]|uniref:DegT/DnrJ/EryC1/StrS family aminotransferase n=1 Tax=Agromyces marinus TaxID=1389020 RepID=UPI001F16ED74|nr:aminotransferase class V-fold PLP-dependent enzyme [Agromyces marinus]UIP58037.1 UDP-4-amino-4-deoxy-L-arabinose--oxoglutarate aminotransferase [Agromyces marinus]
MTIPYGRQSINEDDVAAVVAALRSDWLTMGPASDRFEADIAERAGTPGAVAVSSGTAALHAAYAAAGVGRGDIVVTTPMTFVATAATAAQLGAEIVFADVEDATANIDPDSVASAITPSTRVVAAVDYAGQPADLDALLPIAHGAGALLLEDAAHSIGSVSRSRPVGSIADLTTFSFFPTKNLTTAEGGAVVSTDPALLERVRRFKLHGLVRDRDLQRHPDEGGWHQEVHEFGLNYRLPDVLAALGSSQLTRLERFKARRAAIFDRYVRELSDLDGIRLPARVDGIDPTWHLFALRVLDGRRREVYTAMRERGILVQVNYIPVYWHPVFEDLGYRRGMCPVAERFYAEELSLPMFADLTDDDQSRVIDALREILS